MSTAGRPQWSRIITRTDDEIAWQDRAACAQLPIEVFFPAHGNNIPAVARRICGGCEVRTACLEYALTHKERHGVWGGLSERERRELVGQERARSRNRVNA